MAQVLRVSITGVMPGGEEWSVNPCFSLPGDGSGISFEDLENLATDISALTWPAALQPLNTAQVQVTGTRVEQRELSGALVAAAEAPRSSAFSGNGTTPHPYQTSLVFSLRTAVPGARGRGRLFFPATSVPLTTTTLRISVGSLPSYVNAFISVLAAIEAEIEAYDTASDLVVWSRTAGQLYEVTRVQAGDILDVQRRRRDALVESYASSPYVEIP